MSTSEVPADRPVVAAGANDSPNTSRARTTRLLSRALTMCIATGACGSPAAPDMSMHYSLAMVNGNALPYDQGPLPPRPGTGDACHLLLFTGELEFEPSSSTYSLRYSHKDSCTDLPLGTSGSSGAYRVDGRRVLFEADLGEGRTESYVGTLDDESISVADRLYAYRFVR